MTFPVYSEYKDSDVEWVKKIPHNWKIISFKWLLSRNDGGVWGDEPTGENDTVVLRSTEQTVDGRWEIADPAKRNLSHSEKEEFKLKTGDLLLTKSSGSSLHIGKTTLVSEEISALNCCYSNFMQRIRLKSDVNAKFAWYLMNNRVVRNQFDFLSNSTTGLANLNGSMIGQIRVPSILFEEQTTIVKFLDHETTKIDALIQEQEKLIELLKEKRQAVISKTVCRGLDPNVPMKDSGVEWLGMVPEHWEIKKLKFLTKRISSGKTPKGGAEIYSNIGVTFLRSQNVYDEGLILDDVVKIPFHVDEEMSSTRVKGGDILLNITGASIGRSCVVPIDFENANVNQHVCVIRLIDLRVISYIGLFMKSNLIKNQINFSQNGAAREGLNFEQIGNLKICIPDFLEQQKIVKYVEMEVQKIDSLHSQITNAIELLKERRSSLISAAVTGQIDVRGFCGN